MEKAEKHLELAPTKAEVIIDNPILPITNSLLMTWLTLLLLLVFGIWFKKRISLNPGKFQVAVEHLFESLIDFMDKEVFEKRSLAMKYFPFIATIFIFIAVLNLMKFIPIFDVLYLYHGEEKLHLFRPATADLNTTLAFAIIALVVIEASGVAALGLKKYVGKFIHLKIKSPKDILTFLVGLLELVSEFVKLVAFSFRLFGNIFAGKILLAIVVFFLPYIVPMPLLIFEMFVAIIQAAIFALLTLFFIKLAITEAEH